MNLPEQNDCQIRDQYILHDAPMSLLVIDFCRNLFFNRRARRKEKWVCLLMKKTRGFEKNARKTKKGFANFENKCSGVVYAYGRY